MTFVMDASVLAGFFLKDEANKYVEKIENLLIDNKAIAPDLLNIEMLNIFSCSLRRKRCKNTGLIAFISLLERLPINYQSSLEVNKQVLLDLSVKNDLSIYDTYYLELALRENVPLATQDRKLKRVAVNYGVGVV